MGKNVCFAQRKACFSSLDGQIRLFCPTTALNIRLRDPKMACFGVRRGVFPGSGSQNGLFWGTDRPFPRLRTPKWHVLWYGGVFSQVREPKMAGFGVRRGVFLGLGPQKGLFWGTNGRFSGLGTPNRLVLGHGGVYFQVREPKMAGFGVRRQAEKAEAEG